MPTIEKTRNKFQAVGAIWTLMRRQWKWILVSGSVGPALKICRDWGLCRHVGYPGKGRRDIARRATTDLQLEILPVNERFGNRDGTV